MSAAINIVDLAYQIIDLAEDRDRWKRDALHYKELHEMHSRDRDEALRSSEKLFGEILAAAVDPDSGINRMQRAVLRDPLRGAVEAPPQ